jgi:hypothetical protein
MTTQTVASRRPEAVTQFSVFLANRLGRLHDLISLLSAHSVDVMALTILDTTDSAILRLIVDDPDRARELMEKNGFSYTESGVLVVELDAAPKLNDVMAALLEVELNINYLYCFIPHPHGKSLLAFSMEDNEMAEKALGKRGFKVLRQEDVSR